MQTEYVLARVNLSSLCDYTWQSGKSGDKNSPPTKRLLQFNMVLRLKYTVRILSCMQPNTLTEHMNTRKYREMQ